MNLLFSIVLFYFCAQRDIVLGRISFRVSDVLNSANTIAKGVGTSVLNVIPTPEEIFKAPKQVLFGLPEVAVLNTINNVCSLYLAADTIQPRVTPDMESMALTLRSSCNKIGFSLTHVEEILKSAHFDINKKMAVFVTGWLSTSDENYVAEMADAFDCRGDYNFLVLNSSGSINTLYSWSAYNTEEIGRQLALALKKLVEKVPAKNIQLVGHSLGAHIVGYAGRYFNRYTGLNITRITGLDPANPCFNEGQTMSGLQRGDADFIDVIHTNPDVLGKADPLGDVDFYPEGMTPIKPGCVIFTCSHFRAVRYFTESVYPGNEQNFLGVRCTSLKALNNGFCNGTQFPMGFAVPNNLKGNYFLSVNDKKPYGKNSKNKDAAIGNCRKCDSKLKK